ncbi:hypothetical protein CYMTET_27217 [Cymbomonas tetramitiformis]|uniref:Uncharacterized protein n=1 Tax=Cymbomonas tetramitiformis TaxID=36881 RepID=A0AAE0KX48_9CHLO|nr:hypothetical protein CYMTET_27217 [Cymbomonas tetramitiformis]
MRWAQELLSWEHLEQLAGSRAEQQSGALFQRALWRLECRSDDPMWLEHFLEATTPLAGLPEFRALVVQCRQQGARANHALFEAMQEPQLPASPADSSEQTPSGSLAPGGSEEGPGEGEAEDMAAAVRQFVAAHCADWFRRRDSKGRMALHYAILHNDVQIAKRVLEAMPAQELQLVDMNGCAPLWLAAANGHPALVLQILHLARHRLGLAELAYQQFINRGDKEGFSPLHIALANAADSDAAAGPASGSGHAAVVGELLRAGGDTYTRTLATQRTLLHTLAGTRLSMGLAEELAEQLLSHVRVGDSNLLDAQDNQHKVALQSLGPTG